MRAEPLLNHLLTDEGLARGLGDEEARVLVEWLAERAERLAGEAPSEEAAWGEIERLRKRGRAIGRFVRLWCYEGLPGPATQLAGAERFGWPLPEAEADPYELTCQIVRWEEQRVSVTANRSVG